MERVRENEISDEQLVASKEALEAFMASRTELNADNWWRMLMAGAVKTAHEAGVPEHELAENCYLGRRMFYGGPILTDRGEFSFPAFEAADQSGLAIEIDLGDDEKALESARRLKWLSAGLKKELQPRRENFALFVIPDGGGVRETGYVSSANREDMLQFFTEWVEAMRAQSSGARPLVSMRTLEIIRSMMSVFTFGDVAHIEPHPGKLPGDGLQGIADRAARELESAAHHLYRFELALRGMLETAAKEPAGPGAPEPSVG